MGSRLGATSWDFANIKECKATGPGADDAESEDKLVQHWESPDFQSRRTEGLRAFPAMGPGPVSLRAGGLWRLPPGGRDTSCRTSCGCASPVDSDRLTEPATHVHASEPGSQL